MFPRGSLSQILYDPSSYSFEVMNELLVFFYRQKAMHNY